VDAALIVLGSALALVASLVTQERQRRVDARTRLYLELLPQLEQQLRRYHRVADQKRDHYPQSVLADDDWGDSSAIRNVYRNAVVAGRRSRAFAEGLYEQWTVIARAFDPEIGLQPTALVLADEDVRDASASALATIEEFSRSLEPSKRLLPRRHRGSAR
jgi:hypothetical protein